MLAEIGVIHSNPAATPRHNQPGEHKSAFNNQTAAGATTTSCRPPSPRWHLWPFKDRPATPFPTRHQTLRRGNFGPATTTSIRPPSTRQAPWGRAPQRQSHAVYRHAPAPPPRRAHLRSRA
jgi:hypothetical protein